MTIGSFQVINQLEETCNCDEDCTCFCTEDLYSCDSCNESLEKIIFRCSRDYDRDSNLICRECLKFGLEQIEKELNVQPKNREFFK